MIKIEAISPEVYAALLEASVSDSDKLVEVCPSLTVSRSQDEAGRPVLLLDGCDCGTVRIAFN
ncbi:hypothetical protein [Zobellella aerophila]|uniref:Uncharacterized protein n=1 Tax=Zobellella aerophila TaxID=870480 RepID=A0ABP6W6N4_9GAMM